MCLWQLVEARRMPACNHDAYDDPLLYSTLDKITLIMIPFSSRVERPLPFAGREKGIQNSPPHLQQEEWFEQSPLVPAMNECRRTRVTHSHTCITHEYSLPRMHACTHALLGACHALRGPTHTGSYRLQFCSR